jgi:hypothetical protein
LRYCLRSWLFLLLRFLVVVFWCFFCSCFFRIVFRGLLFLLLRWGFSSPLFCFVSLFCLFLGALLPSCNLFEYVLYLKLLINKIWLFQKKNPYNSHPL